MEIGNVCIILTSLVLLQGRGPCSPSRINAAVMSKTFVVLQESTQWSRYNLYVIPHATSLRTDTFCLSRINTAIKVEAFITLQESTQLSR